MKTESPRKFFAPLAVLGAALALVALAGCGSTGQPGKPGQEPAQMSQQIPAPVDCDMPDTNCQNQNY